MPHPAPSTAPAIAGGSTAVHRSLRCLGGACLVMIVAILGTRPPSAAAQTAVDPVGSPQFLPLIDEDGSIGCRSHLHLQAPKHEPTRAMVFFWGRPAGCGSAEARPLDLLCTGLLNPGASWVLTGPSIPAGAQSATIFSLSADLGLQNPDPLPPEPLTGWFCDLMRGLLAQDAEAYPDFLEAYRTGGTWQGVDLRLARGGPIALQLQRDCEAEVGDSGSMALPGISASSLEPAERKDDTWIYRLPVFVGPEERVVVQNASSRCADLQLWLRQSGPDCQPTSPLPCPVPASLAPGESRALDLAACLASGSAASLELHSQGPLAILSQVGTARTAPAAVSMQGESGTRLQAPLVIDLTAGWSGRVLVHSQDAGRPADLRMQLLDANGTQLAVSQHVLCPSQAASLEVDVPDVGPIRGNSLRIESRALDPPDAGQAAPAIRAILELQREGAYRERTRYPMQVVSLDPMSRGDRAVLALPFARPRFESGGISRLTIQNQSPDPGFAVVGIYFYDQNGLLDFLCRELRDQQLDALDLVNLPIFNTVGFRSSFVISATYWEHLAFTPPDQSSNHLSLAAAISEHSGIGAPPVEAWTQVAAPVDRFAAGFEGFLPPCPVAGSGPLPTRPPGPTPTAFPTPSGPGALWLPLLQH